MNPSQGVYPLQGVVQHYAWGGEHYLPALLGISNMAQKPFAEYWLGAHPNHPSTVRGATPIALSQFIARDPQAVLGTQVAQQFGTLPYLLKVLDVKAMLSIQVHPSKASAEEDYAAENAQGIPVNAPHRNYKDDNHKPELMAALSDFWLLHGFKAEAPLREVLQAIPEFAFLLPVFESGGYKGLYEEVMLMEQDRVNAVLQPLLARIVPLYERGGFSKDEASFWAARAALSFCRDDNYDRGIFSIYFFNLVHLERGEGIFQAAGLPHAYLEGQNMEVMANSDNVLRAGLTDKHIDVRELMKHVRFEATVPQIIRPAAQADRTVFKSPAREFELQSYQLKAGARAVLQAKTAEIWLCLEGEAHINSTAPVSDWKQGEALLLLPQTALPLEATNATLLFGVTVPGS